MEIILKKINELKNYEKNARTHGDKQIGELMDSIKNFGFLDPVEIDKNNVIISGHARVEAAKKLGIEEIPTVCHLHLTKSEQKQYILAANRIAQNAGWSSDLLRDEFSDLYKDNINPLSLGFTSDEIDAIMHPNVLQDFEEADAPFTDKVDPMVKRGDVWVLGGHRLMCGDSTSSDDVSKLLNAAIPNLMVTDPPYGVEYDPEWREGVDLGVGERAKGKVKNDNRVDWSEAYSLFPGDVAYVWHAGKFTHVVAENLEKCGFQLINQIIWCKQHFALSRGDYHWQHEPLWYVVRKGKRHNWKGGRDQATVWEIKNNNSFGNQQKEETWGHGTQKPIDCMLRPILNNSLSGDFIYDPFGGSGTTLIACEQSSRKCLMMELDEKYCDIIIQRWQKVTGKTAVREINNW